MTYLNIVEWFNAFLSVCARSGRSVGQQEVMHANAPSGAALACRARAVHSGETRTQAARARFSAPWFASSKSELDRTFRMLYAKDESKPPTDHPDFTDREHLWRRREKVLWANYFRHGMPWPDLLYRQSEHDTWRQVFEELDRRHRQFACAEFNENKQLLERRGVLVADRIAPLSVVNAALKECTGFELWPCAGTLLTRALFQAFAFRAFPAVQFIRHASRPFYAGEPDYLHEVFGHVPLLADPTVALCLETLGLAAHGASKEDLELLMRVYYHLFEFGLVRHADGSFRVMGAGLLSSATELVRAATGEESSDSLDASAKDPAARTGGVSRAPFDVEALRQERVKGTYLQERYFYVDSLEHALHIVRELAKQVTAKRAYDVHVEPRLELRPKSILADSK